MNVQLERLIQTIYEAGKTMGNDPIFADENYEDTKMLAMLAIEAYVSQRLEASHG